MSFDIKIVHLGTSCRRLYE